MGSNGHFFGVSRAPCAGSGDGPGTKGRESSASRGRSSRGRALMAGIDAQDPIKQLGGVL